MTRMLHIARTASRPALHDPRRNAMLGALPDKSYYALEPYLRIRERSAGVSLWMRGEPPASVYFPLCGVIQVTLAVGPRQIEVAQIGHEAAAGGLGGGAAAATCGATMTEATIASIEAATFRHLANWDRALGAATERACSWIALQAQCRAGCNAVHRTEARLSSWLLDAASRSADGRVIARQEDIAASLGLLRTTVTQAAQLLAADRLISYHRGRIDLRNRDGLKARACGCYAALSPPHWPFAAAKLQNISDAPPIAAAAVHPRPEAIRR
jgi:CRP-like cAMP-binding protein